MSERAGATAALGNCARGGAGWCRGGGGAVDEGGRAAARRLLGRGARRSGSGLKRAPCGARRRYCGAAHLELAEGVERRSENSSELRSIRIIS